MATFPRMLEPEKAAAGFPAWVMLDRTGRTSYLVADHPDLKALENKEGTACKVDTSSGLSGYFSFTLSQPPDVSYLDFYWPIGPEESPSFPDHHAFSSVMAADENLLLLRIAIPSMRDFNDPPHDLFVYTAAAPRSSVERLPLYTERPQKGFVQFCVRRSGIGILRLAGDQSHYLVADLIVDKPIGSVDHVAEVCVFFSAAKKTRRNWKVFTITKLQPIDGGQFPVRWLTSTVLPFDGRFLCWVDYFSGILMLSDFSQTKAPATKFLTFPGEQYSNKVRMGTGRCCPDRFRSVSISQGMMRFIDIDNDFHETRHKDEPRKKSGPKEITTWSLNLGTFEWEKTRAINLETLWASYEDPTLPKCLPEFPVISMDDPDHVWCILREDFHGKAWKIVVDMKHAKLYSCTSYVKDHPYYAEGMDRKNYFANEPLLPAVFSKYLNNPTGIPEGSGKFATRSSKKGKLSVQDLDFRPC